MKPSKEEFNNENRLSNNYHFRAGTRFVLLLTVLFAASMGMAQVQVQKGVSYRYNGKNPRTPLPNVVIKYDPERQPAISDSTGAFELKFSNRKMGDRIGLVTVTKREMMVFNQQAVDEWSIRKEPLCLILCDANEFELQKQNLIDIGKREAQKKYDRQRAELEQQLAASQIDRAKYEDELDKAYEELARLREHLDEYADLFARIDQSEIDSTAQQAMDLFNQGQVDEAIRLFEQGNYMEKLKASNRAMQQADNMIETAEAVKAKAEKDKEELLQSLKSQIAAYKMKNEWGKAGALQKSLADELNTALLYLEYAVFCQSQNHFDEAECYYQKAIKGYRLLAQDNPEDKFRLAMALYNLGSLYHRTLRYKESEEMFLESLDIIRPLTEENPKFCIPGLAFILNGLGIFYRDTQKWTESEAAFQEALNFLRQLEQDDTQNYKIAKAHTLDNLARLYMWWGRISECEALYLEAIEIRKQLVQIDPKGSEGDLITSVSGLASLYMALKRYSESEALLLENLEYDRRMAKNNPEACEPDLASTLTQLGDVYGHTHRFKESEAMYSEALEIRRRLAQSNPRAFEERLGHTLYSFGLIYSQEQKNYSESEKLFLESLEIYRRLSSKNYESTEVDLAIVLTCLLDIYKETQQFAKCEDLCVESLPIFRHLVENTPQNSQYDWNYSLAYALGCLAKIYFQTQRYQESEAAYLEGLSTLRRLVDTHPDCIPDLSSTLLKLSHLYYVTQRFSESEALYLEALTIHRQLAKDNLQKYGPELDEMLNNLARLYYDSQRLTDSENIQLEILELRRQLAKIDPQTYDLYVALSLNNLGIMYQNSERYTESEAMFMEALDIFRRSAQANPQYCEPNIAAISSTLGYFKVVQGQYQDAIPYYEESLGIYRKLAAIDPNQQQWYEESLHWLVKLNAAIGNHAKCCELYEEYIPLLENGFKTDPNYREAYSVALSSYAFYCLFMGQLEKAEQCAREAVTIDSTQHWINTNLAATLLLRGKYSEAEAIYRQYKDELKDIFLQDLQDFEAAGIITEERKEDLEKIRELLNE